MRQREADTPKLSSSSAKPADQLASVADTLGLELLAKFEHLADEAARVLPEMDKLRRLLELAVDELRTQAGITERTEKELEQFPFTRSQGRRR